MATTFSRLQLAAALLEYDNDPDDPTAPRKNAKDSAIFAHMRRPPKPVRRDLEEDSEEDVPLRRGANKPSQRRSVSYGPSNGDFRKATNPDLVGTPAAARTDEGARVLSEWGLEAFAPTGVDTDAEREQKEAKLKQMLSIRERTHSEALPNPHGPPSPMDDAVNTSPIRRFPMKRPLSMGDIDDLVIGESPERTRAAPTVIDYRKSVHTNLDFSPHLVLPSEDSDHSPAKEEEEQDPFNSNSVAFPTKSTPIQTPIAEAENPFAVPLPSPDRMSRFDPKAVEEETRRSSSQLRGRKSSDAAARRLSIGSMGSQLLMDAASNVPAEPRSRRTSAGTMGTKLLRGDGNASRLGPTIVAPKEDDDRRLSRIELMRPKLLVMPSPLQDVASRIDVKQTRDGFFRSESGGFPLPPGSRTEVRPGVSARPMSTLSPSQSFNPRMSMSLSQLTFRQSLMVGGQRDPSYADLDQHLHRSEVDGQQAGKDWSDEEDETEVGLRPPGKLYGKSLIDNLEARKAVIKGQQRVFTGDQRPSMMSRPVLAPRIASSTFIDPNDLQKPSGSYLSPAQVQEDLRKRRASGIPTPLLNFDPNLSPGYDGPPPGPSRPNLPNSRSVFGVDKVWERELAKLKVAEEAERAEKAKLDDLDARIADKKKARLSTMSQSPSNMLNSIPGQTTSGSPLAEELSTVNGQGQKGTASSAEGRRESAATLGAKGWFNGATSDEEEDPRDRRLSAASWIDVKPQYPRKVSAPSGLPQIPSGNLNESDEDEDVPLAQQTRRSYAPPVPSQPPVDDSDSEEDKPIATLKPRNPASGQTFDLPVINFNNLATTKAKNDESSDEDEVPLAVRHPTASRLSSMSMLSPAISGGQDDSDEDDKPLGATYRASTASLNLQVAQQQMMQQHLLQQQIMLQTQAQLRASMGFGDMMSPGSMMGGSAAFGMPFAPAPMSMHSMNGPGVMHAVQNQAAVQHSRVDQWRKDVV